MQTIKIEELSLTPLTEIEAEQIDGGAIPAWLVAVGIGGAKVLAACTVVGAFALIGYGIYKGVNYLTEKK
jgi:hypothetical protein